MPGIAAQPGCSDLTDDPLVRNSKTPDAWLSEMPTALTALVLVEVHELAGDQSRDRRAAHGRDLKALRLEGAGRRETDPDESLPAAHECAE
jgi:hypothetical protein